MLTTEAFQTAKATSTLVVLGLATILQSLLPYRHSQKDLWANWRINYSLALFNALILNALVNALSFGAARVTEIYSLGFMGTVGFMGLEEIGFPLRLAASVLILDLTAYGWHRANHVVPKLWRFHAVHHSDTFFDVSTALRFHPIEILLSAAVRITVITCAGVSTEGLLAFELIYGWANLIEHTNSRWHPWIEGVWEKVFVTPALHRLHHAANAKDLNRNFSTIFSFWDRLFGTWTNARSSDNIATGLPGQPPVSGSFVELLKTPFRRSRA